MTRVLIPLADGCEEIEAVTLIDLLRRAGFEVVTASLDPGPVTCSRGVVLVADHTLDDLPRTDFDLIVLPGGAGGADRLRADARLQRLLERHHGADRWTAAICAAPAVLAAFGLLEGRQATAFPGALEAVGAASSGAPIEFDGPIATSRGPGTAMDFALALIEAVGDRGLRQEVEGRLQR
jgi:4-methyl-5(b-hydroxyethyl)-thiazole monophosphate biosynthesis